MIKTISIIIFSSLTLSSCYSQTFKDKNYVGFSIGPSIPIGNYGSKDMKNDLAGFAKIGLSMNLSYGIKLRKHVGISAMLLGQLNPLNKKALENEFSQAKISDGVFFASSTTDPPPSPPSYTIYPNWKFDKDSWKMGSFLLGADGEFPSHSRNLFLIAKAMMGVIYVTSPEISGNSTTDTATANVKQNSVSAFGVSYLLRGGIKYMVNRKMGILFSVDHFSTNNIKFKDIKATFDSVKYVDGFPSSTQSSITADGKQKINAINVNVGLHIKI